MAVTKMTNMVNMPAYNQHVCIVIAQKPLGSAQENITVRLLPVIRVLHQTLDISVVCRNINC